MNSSAAMAAGLAEVPNVLEVKGHLRALRTKVVAAVQLPELLVVWLGLSPHRDVVAFARGKPRLVIGRDVLAAALWAGPTCSEEIYLHYVVASPAEAGEMADGEEVCA
jgi:hypothetical protein